MNTHCHIARVSFGRTRPHDSSCMQPRSGRRSSLMLMFVKIERSVCTLSALSPNHENVAYHRYYSDPEQEFLKGNCTCIRPLDDSVESTFDAWYNRYDESQTTSASEAALQVGRVCASFYPGVRRLRTIRPADGFRPVSLLVLLMLLLLLLLFLPDDADDCSRRTRTIVLNKSDDNVKQVGV